MVRYMGERRDAGGDTVYVFPVNDREATVPAPGKAHRGPYGES